MKSADALVVTIGLCVKNAENTIKETLISLNKQNFQHDLMELVVVDDGSTDNTFKVLSSITSGIDIETKVFQTKWKGLGSARNLIVKNAKGRYILFVDGDQILPRDYIERQVKVMEENPNVGIAAGTPGFLKNNSFVLNLELIPCLIDYHQFNVKRKFPFKSEKLPGTGGTIYRTKAMRGVKGFDERLMLVGEDQDVAKEIKNSGWEIRLNDVRFYERHGNMSNFVALWRKYFRYGYGNQLLYTKRSELFSVPRLAPFAGIVAGIFYSIMAYKLTSNKIVFLLPLHFTIKKTAWFLGFVKGQLLSSALFSFFK